MAAPLSVLLVEDSQVDARVIEEILKATEEADIRVESVTTLQEGVEHLEEDGAADLVILDLGLPDSQGLDTLVTFHRSHPDVPVIVLTALEDQEAALQALREGAYDYLVKDDLGPFSLVHAVRATLARREAAQALEAQLEELLGGEVPSSPSSVASSALREIKASASEAMDGVLRAWDALATVAEDDEALAKRMEDLDTVLEESVDAVARIDALAREVLRSQGVEDEAEGGAGAGGGSEPGPEP